MRIELCEDNGFLSPDGRPTLVVLVVTRDDGKQVRIPYQADKTIQELYDDVKKLTVQSKILPPPETPTAKKEEPGDPGREALALSPPPVSSNGQIERNDIVVCTETVKDFDNKEFEGRDIEVGREYRILDIYKQNGKLMRYDLIDDEKDDKIRIPCFPSEIKLVRKFTPKIRPVKSVFEIIEKCECGESNALELNGNQYQGTCSKCGKSLSKERPVPAESA